MREREEQIAEQMLTDLVELTPSLRAVDEDDLRLEGKLALLLELVTVLGRWNVGTKSGGGLVHRLITGRLSMAAPCISTQILRRLPLLHKCWVASPGGLLICYGLPIIRSEDLQ